MVRALDQEPHLGVGGERSTTPTPKCDYSYRKSHRIKFGLKIKMMLKIIKSRLKDIKKVINASFISMSGMMKFGLQAAVYSLGVSGAIFLILRLILGVEISITNILLLAMLFLIPIMVSVNTEFLKQILVNQQTQTSTYWDYRVYQVDENPAHVSPMIRISNSNDIAELLELGHKSLNDETGKIQALQLEKGMSMLNRIGWELVQVQKIGEFKYYYIFRRVSIELTVI